VLEPAEACATAVLAMGEAAAHPHNLARGNFVEIAGQTQPAPAPRFSRTSPDLPAAPAEPGADTDSALAAWGFDAGEISSLRESGAFG
jgi:alpha-methylacyl-CoA racemase